MTLGVNRGTVRRQPSPDKDANLRRRLRERAEERQRFGVQRLHIFLRREGLVVNHRRTERVHREEGLSLRLRPSGKMSECASDMASGILFKPARKH